MSSRLLINKKYDKVVVQHEKLFDIFVISIGFLQILYEIGNLILGFITERKMYYSIEKKCKNKAEENEKMEDLIDDIDKKL